MANKGKADSGAALVEAALVLPILLLLLFGVVDFSIFAWQSNSASKAVQLGVRKAVVSNSVAVGAGLTVPESAAYWNGLPLGARCRPEANLPSPCPVFTVRCSLPNDCRCDGQRCGFGLAQENLIPIISAMRAALPQLQPDQVELTYAMNYLGYVGRPVPVPVDVTVRIIDLKYNPIFLKFAAVSLPIRASATSPSEAMTDDRSRYRL